MKGLVVFIILATPWTFIFAGASYFYRAYKIKKNKSRG